ncbi:DUF1778 domain-containing protein [Candidatus Poriferisodalis sp.]|uniref:type II toxin -antitoxin system TacA 1-like antitoxin n=1 Tax=Candidatus Poriferisodalis sp. TaxID=3101277 RepID=UPI003B0118CF
MGLGRRPPSRRRRLPARVTRSPALAVTRLDDALGEDVMSCTSAAASDYEADHRVFALSPDEWDQLSDILDRPVRDKPRLSRLLAEPTVLGCHSRGPAAG